jgi:hypothetical protein
MEKFLSAIPGSFNTDWGTEVWKRVGEHDKSEDQSQDGHVARPRGDTTGHELSSSWSIRSIVSHLVMKATSRHPPTHATTPNVPAYSTTAHNQGENVIQELSTRVARSVEICRNRGLFGTDDSWRKRTRACIESTASLVCCANVKIDMFGGISELLGEIGSFEKVRELSLAGTDQLFVMRWTCLSLVAIRSILEDSWDVQNSARQTLDLFELEDYNGNTDSNFDALETARKIDKTLKKASDCLGPLGGALFNAEDLTEEVKQILRDHESEISELEQINIEADRLQWADNYISDVQQKLDDGSHQITSQLPGVLGVFDFDCRVPMPFSRLVDLSRDTRALQFLRPRQTLMSMCSPTTTLRNILEGQGDADAYKELKKNLDRSCFSSWRGDDTQRQVLYLQDLGEGGGRGGLGFIVELFFLALSQLLSTSSSKESHSALYMGTFRAITSDWSKHKDSLGTQKLLLNISITRRQEFDDDYPVYVAEEFLLLLGNIFEGQSGPHIDNARQQFEGDEFYWADRKFGERVLKVLTRG